MGLNQSVVEPPVKAPDLSHMCRETKEDPVVASPLPGKGERLQPASAYFTASPSLEEAAGRV